MDKNMLLYPFYSMFHPVEGFEGIKWYKKGSMKVSFVLLFIFFAATIFIRQTTGFIFNFNRVDKLNLLMEFSRTILPFILWVVANWSLCTLMDGEGRFSEIWISTVYALWPYIIVSVPGTILSNLLAEREGAFLGMIQGIALGWSLILLILAMKEIHQYTLKKTLISMLLTVFGMGVIIFLGVLIFSLFQQLFLFLYTVYSEIKFRL